MTICLVSQEYPPESASGGIGTQTWNKARALSRRGHTVHVLSCGVQPDLENRTASHDGIIVHRMPPPDAYVRGTYNPATYWVGFSWVVLQNLRRLLLSVPFDVIDFPEYGAQGFSFQLDRTSATSVPVVVQLHGPLAMFAERIGWPSKESDFFRVLTFMERYSITHADALMACSSNIAGFTAEYYDVAPDAIDVVHCGVDSETFHPPLENERSERPTVLFAGNIAGAKGLGTAVDAVLRLKARHPTIRIRIAGKPHAGVVEQLKARARREGAESSVEFLGFLGRDDIAMAFREADVFCSPAQHEPGVANVYIEAMASGCPVVACNTGGAPEAVVDGVSGLLVPWDDVNATAGAIDHIVSNPPFRSALARAARRRVDEYFAMDQYIERVLATYERAIRACDATLTPATTSS